MKKNGSETLADIAKNTLKTQLETALMSISGTDNSAEFQVKDNQTPEGEGVEHYSDEDLQYAGLQSVEPMRAAGRGSKQNAGVVGNESPDEGKNNNVKPQDAVIDVEPVSMKEKTVKRPAGRDEGVLNFG